MKVIILDIEGTTTDINFVHNVLFPYAKEKLPDFLKENSLKESIKPIVESIKTNYQLSSLNDVITLMLNWIETDQKIKELKDLQGLIWVDGYNKKDFVAHIYPDVEKHLKKWKEQGIKLYIYSSGSVFAQKLLFSHTEYGDLTSYLDGYFDTSIGKKKKEQSYRNIIESLKEDPSEVLFLSDIEEELACADSVGINVIHINRDGLYNQSNFKLAQSFNELGDFKNG